MELTDAFDIPGYLQFGDHRVRIESQEQLLKAIHVLKETGVVGNYIADLSEPVERLFKATLIGWSESGQSENLGAAYDIFINVLADHQDEIFPGQKDVAGKDIAALWERFLEWVQS